MSEQAGGDTPGLTGPGVAIATDPRDGMVDRLRTLPISRSAYLLGHALSEWAGLLVAIVVLTLSGLLVGWSIHTGIGEAVAGFALLALFAMAMLWVGTAIGLRVRSPDAVQGIVFVCIFPLSFFSNAFVPTDGMPGILQTIAGWTLSPRSSPRPGPCSGTRLRPRPTRPGRLSTRSSPASPGACSSSRPACR